MAISESSQTLSSARNAVLDECGGVSDVQIDCRGRGYSNDVQVLFYTNVHAFHQQAQPILYDPTKATPPTQHVELEIPLDSAARDVDFVLRVDNGTGYSVAVENAARRASPIRMFVVVMIPLMIQSHDSIRP